jgi:hypothetical protein
MDLYSNFILTANGVICIVKILKVMFVLLAMLLASHSFLNVTAIPKYCLQNHVYFGEFVNADAPIDGEH